MTTTKDTAMKQAAAMCSPEFEERKDMNNPNNLVQDQQRNDLVVDDIQEDIGSMVATAAESSKEAKVRIYLNPTSLGRSKQNNGSMGYEKPDFNGVYTKPTSEEYSRQNNGSMALSVTAEFWSVSHGQEKPEGPEEPPQKETTNFKLPGRTLRDIIDVSAGK